MSSLKHTILSCITVIAVNAIAGNKPVSTVDSLPKNAQLNWYNMDLRSDKVAGVGTERVYRELLHGKTPKREIIVAIIDGGTDTEHEDLIGRIWVNAGEVAGNSVDDDNNGYVDDIHGWNFLGNADGENVDYETLEHTRVFRQYKDDFDSLQRQDIVEDKLKEYDLFVECRSKYFDQRANYQAQRDGMEQLEDANHRADSTIKEYLRKEDYMIDEVRAISTKIPAVAWARKYLILLNKRGFKLSDLDGMKKRVSEFLDKYLNMEFDPRKIVGDDPASIEGEPYGNNDVIGPGAEHGTAVGGIVAGTRNNGLGIDGIAGNAKLMILRTVPQGDEYDKDVALAIRYAVDNGANVINMSFGKTFSPQKEFVHEAVKYAESKGVLLIGAAGNNGENVEEVIHYPTKRFDDGYQPKSWLVIGASSRTMNKKLPASFSNYGGENVDLFAPGHQIPVLAPGNKYDVLSGTSFASPVVAGVAALVWSYFPELTAEELSKILVRSVEFCGKRKVIQPNTTTKKKTKVRFATLSKTGGVISAYRAVLLASGQTLE